MLNILRSCHVSAVVSEGIARRSGMEDPSPTSHSWYHRGCFAPQVVTTEVCSSKALAALWLLTCVGVWRQRWEATANSAGKNGVNICSIGAQYFSDVPLCKCTQVLNSQASDDNVYHVNSICLPCDWIKMCCQCARNSAGQGILTDSGMLICRSTRNRQISKQLEITLMLKSLSFIHAKSSSGFSAALLNSLLLVF